MNKSQKLVDSIIKGIQDKKGSGIVVADLTQTDGAVCSYFIICQGNSPTQVEAIAGSVGDYVREAEGEKPVSCIGLGLAQWVAIDFVDVMVHIFLPEAREFYDLEHLLGGCEADENPGSGLKNRLFYLFQLANG